MLLCGGTAVADAQQPQLATASHWLVGPVAGGDDETARRFCSIKASFSNQVNFVLAREAGGGQSLALEYPSKAFAAGASLPVVLAAGDKQMQAEALAATNRVLLMQAPQGGDLEQGLGQSGIFSVRMAQSYQAFAMGGMAAAQEQLAACVAALADGAEFAVVKVPAGDEIRNFQSSDALRTVERKTVSDVSPQEARSFIPAVAAREALLEDEIRRLQKENARLMQENQKMAAELVAIDAGGGRGTATTASPRILRSSKTVAIAESFDAAVATYLSTEAARCAGDFAHKLGEKGRREGRAWQDAEIACLDTPDGAATDYAAALAFTRDRDNLAVEVFQGPAGMIEQALAARAAFRSEQQ